MNRFIIDRDARKKSIVIVCSFLALCFSSCLSTITSIYIPSEISVGETFNIVVRGTVEGDHEGFAGVVIQVPRSFHFEHAVYNSSIARRTLKRNKYIEGEYEAEEGYYIVAFIDSAKYVRTAKDELQLIATFIASDSGSYTIKILAGCANYKEGLSSWETTDPKHKYSFAKIVDPKYIVSCTAHEAAFNGSLALQFDGEHSYAALPLIELLTVSRDSNFTVETWLRTSSSYQVILSDRRDDVRAAFLFELSLDEEGSLVLSTSDGLNVSHTASQHFISDGSWHHIALSHSAVMQKFYMYIDGICEDSLGAISDEKEMIREQSQLYIASRDGRIRFLKGVLEEMRIWNTERTADEIRIFRNISLSGFENGLAALYNFDNSSDGYIHNDASGIELDLIAYNFPKLIQSTAPLKVEFTTFRAEVLADSVIIYWESFDEKNVSHYILEKRYESGNYFVIDKRDAEKSRSSHSEYSVGDKREENKVCFYRLRRINDDGSIHLSDELPVGAEDIHNFMLEQNSPDPFSSSTSIIYRLDEAMHVTLSIYDYVGRRVKVLIDDHQEAGSHSVTFVATDLPSGIYFYKLRTASGSETKKMHLSK